MEEATTAYSLHEEGIQTSRCMAGYFVLARKVYEGWLRKKASRNGVC